MSTVMSPEVLADLRRLAAQGKTAVEIGTALGCKARWVRSAVERHGIALRKLSPAEIRARARDAKVALGHRVGVPAWVPDDLIEDYRDQRAAQGKAWAARTVRRLMADMRAAEATP